MSYTPQLSRGGKLGYATGIYGVFLAWMMLSLYLLYFYTDVLGLSPAQAGLVFFLASMWDGISDPLMAWLIENTRSRWGRYRPYLLFGAVPLAAAFVVLFYKPDLQGNSLFVWALVLHIVFRTAYTAIYIPYTSLIAQLSTDADERASIAGYKSVFISFASLTISFLGLPAVTYLGGADEAAGFLRFAMICAGLAVLTVWLCFLFTKERVAEEGVQMPPPSSLKDGLSALSHNTPFLLIVLGVFAFTGCYTILNKAIVYVFKYDLGDRDAARWALSAIALAGILSPLIWVRLTHWTSKRVTWIAGCLLASFCLALMYFGNIRNLPLLVGLFFIAGSGIHAFLMTFFAMVADAADFGEWQNGTRVEAPLFGVLSFANKASLAIGAWALSYMLDGVGFVANVEQSPDTILGMRQIMCLVPITGFLASAAIIWFFPVTTERQREIMAELEQRRRQPAAEEKTVTAPGGSGGLNPAAS